MLDLSKISVATSLTPRNICAKPQPVAETRRAWTTGDIAEIISAAATYKTADIANALGVNPKALRSLLRRQGISLRGLRHHARTDKVNDSAGLFVKRSCAGPSAVYGAAALENLADNACRWPIGDPSEPSFAFCGADIQGRRSYCNAHQIRALEPCNRNAK